ncbi:MAG: type II secretion system protein [Armatimonadetes bacterium]|nr:type II secretion system protein [Armatimonadota bacterium]
MRRGRGFTLIELLVVIAIIAVLTAVLFPVFVQAKESAKQTQCILQMRQIGLGLALYRDANDDVWPATANMTQAPGYPPQMMWMGYDTRNAGLNSGFYGRMDQPAKYPAAPGMIDPYLKNEAIKRCPNTPTGYQMVIAYSWFNQMEMLSPYYQTNPKAKGNEYGPGGKNCNSVPYMHCEGVGDSEVEEPTATLVAWEHGAFVPACNFLQRPGWFDVPPWTTKRHFEWLHHEGGVTLWADSRAKRIVYGALRRPYFSVRKDIYR